MLTYDEVWSTFLDNYKVNPRDLPQDNPTIYQDIRNAVMQFNNRLRTEAQCDDVTETITGVDTNDDRLLIAQYIKLAYLINSKTLYETLYQPMTADVGLRNYRTQVTSLETSIKRQEETIEKIIFNSREDFL